MDQEAKATDIQSQISDKESLILTTASDQERLRQNIKALGQSLEERKLLQRYVAKLEATETLIETLRAEIAALTAAKNKMQDEINIKFRNLATE